MDDWSKIIYLKYYTRQFKLVYFLTYIKFSVP